MPSQDMQGLVQTVLGLIEPSELGPTTTHEHLYIDFSFMYRPAQDSALDLSDAPITLENLGWVRHNHYSSHANLRLMDVETAVAEASLYKAVGRRRDSRRHHDRHRAGRARAGTHLARVRRACGHGRGLLCRRRPSPQHGLVQCGCAVAANSR